MPRSVHDALASYPAETTVRRELHDVPSHRVYEVTFGGRRAVCKVAAGPTADPAVEGRLLELLQRETDLPVPEVLAVGRDHFVAAWLEALPDDPTVDAARLRALGAGLAAFHDATESLFDRPGLFASEGDRLRVGAEDRWSDALVRWLRRRRDYLASMGFADCADRAIRFVREHRALLDGADDVTLVHGNYLPDHVGVGDDGSVAAVIDLEHALAGPSGFDYVRSAMPLFGPDADHGVPESFFREGYESVRPLPAGFDDRRPAYEALNLVSYLRALHVQRGDRDSHHCVARRARGLAEEVGERFARRP